MLPASPSPEDARSSRCLVVVGRKCSSSTLRFTERLASGVPTCTARGWSTWRRELGSGWPRAISPPCSRQSPPSRRRTSASTGCRDYASTRGRDHALTVSGPVFDVVRRDVPRHGSHLMVASSRESLRVEGGSTVPVYPSLAVLQNQNVSVAAARPERPLPEADRPRGYTSSQTIDHSLRSLHQLKKLSGSE